MFKQLRNIDTAFRHVRAFTLVIVLASAGIVIVSLTQSFIERRESAERIYILYNGKVLEAVASTRRENIPVEARDHVTDFHRLFFTLSPDEKAIEQSIGKALYLADRSAKDQYDNLKEAGFFAGIISANISQNISPDSIQLDVTRHPFHFRYFGKQTIVRPTATIVRSLVTEGLIRQVTKSENNPHGLLIERWAILNNSDFSVQPR